MLGIEADVISYATLQVIREQTYLVHRSLCAAGKIGIESLANVDNIPVHRAHLLIFPLNVKDGTRAPVKCRSISSII